jgi:TolA-binding protein
VARASRPNPDVEYERALAMAGSDPRAAVKTLDRLAELGGAQAEPARLRAARLAARYDAAESARRLEAFLAQHGHGPFAHDARLDLVEQRLRGGLGAAEGAVAAFLARHPDSARAPEMLVVRGEIARAVHRRCEAALADYERALPSSRAAEGALRGKALCLRDLGDQAGARAAAEAYLRRHPAGRHASELRAMIASLPRTSP